MDNYAFLVFLHVFGTAGLFAAWGAEMLTVWRLRKAETVDEVLKSTQLFKKQNLFGPISMLTILATGIWMGMLRWGYQSWMAVAFFVLVLIVIIGVLLPRRVRPHLKQISIDNLTELPPNFAQLAGILLISIQVRISLGVGILALMTMKLQLFGSMVIMSMAVSIGVILAAWMSRNSAASLAGRRNQAKTKSN